MPIYRRWRTLLCTLVLLAPNAQAQEINLVRGEALYRNHCNECHESLVHIRDRPRAKSRQELRLQVVRWSDEIDQQWGSDEIEDIVGYLDFTYYRFAR
ncbi:MAG: cytochrome C [Proteobacteria bacterium]|nr:MAG: cytochrome C [Pseudomonadota bacterium]QKK11237.1 MAG: cytochrome C [Pseudomonadota bacterium]